MDDFEPAPAASPVFSLREHLVGQGLPSGHLSSALNAAHHLSSTIKGLDLRRYNPRTDPMCGQSSG